MKKLLLLLLLHIAVLAAPAQSYPTPASPPPSQPSFGSATISLLDNEYFINTPLALKIENVKDQYGNPYRPLAITCELVANSIIISSSSLDVSTDPPYSTVLNFTQTGTYSIKVFIDNVLAFTKEISVGYVPILESYDIEILTPLPALVTQNIRVRLSNLKDQFGNPYNPKLASVQLTASSVTSGTQVSPLVFDVHPDFGSFLLPDFLNGFALRTTVDDNIKDLPIQLCPGTVLYVNANHVNTTSADNGVEWIRAFTNLQDALTLARAYPCVKEIWVAKGTYKPTTGTDRTISFSMVNGVKIYGGFAGTETNLADRNWKTNVTILSGDLNGDDVIAGSGSTLSITNNAENSYHVIYNDNNGLTTTNSVLDGFTITGGNANPNGGINSLGGGMLNINSSPSLSHVIFSANNAGRDGGGMVNDNGSSPSLSHVTFSGNYAAGGGGMFNNNSSSPSLSNVTFSGNNARNLGGGMCNTKGSSPGLSNVTFSGNNANSDGGGLYNASSSPSLSNVTFSGNIARSGSGGGLYNISSSPSLSNVTFSGNNAFASGGGMYNISSFPVIKNSIFWGNKKVGTTVSSIENVLSSTPSVSYSDIEGGYDGTGNINQDPLFINAANPAGTDGIFGTADDGLALQPCSPAINAGNNTDVSTTDLAGNPRIVASTVDMGAYEYQYDVDKIVYVNANGPSATPDGETWATAFKNLQDALARTKTCPGVTQIWLAKGTYYPDQGGGKTAGDRNASFSMVEGVKIYGGFSGNGTETSLEQRDWTLNPTVLSGDIDHPSDPQKVSVVEGVVTITGNSGNSYHVIYNNDNGLTNEKTLLDGFIVTGGYAYDKALGIYNGGGMFNYGSYPAVKNCQFNGNVAGFGAGMSNRPAFRAHSNEKVFPIVYNTVFSHNHAIIGGGGLYNETETASITNCRFVENSTSKEGGDGGGLYIGGLASVEGCVFEKNLAYNGGGLHANGRGGEVAVRGLSVKNCLFNGNIAEVGGGQYNLEMPLTVYNSSYFGNSAKVNGGGLLNLRSLPTITNCTFSGNYAGTGGGGIATDASPITFTNCIIWANAGGEVSDNEYFPCVYSHSLVKGLSGGTDGNLDGTNEANNPLFVIQPTPSIEGTINGDLRLQPCSPAINAGTNGSFTAADKDLDGNGRIFGTTIDMGAYEFQAVPQSLKTFYKDADGDSYGNPDMSLQACLRFPPDGYVTDNTDCNDNDAAINPGATLTLATPATIRANTSDDGTGNCTVVLGSITPPAVLGNNCGGPYAPIATINGEVIDPVTYAFSRGVTTILWMLEYRTTELTKSHPTTKIQSARVEQKVIVTDNEKPVFTTTLPNIVLKACEATATWQAPTANDNCEGVTVSQTAGLAPGSIIANGTTVTVEYSAEDAGGLKITTSFTITRDAAVGGNAVSTPILCFSGQSQVTVTGTGGKAPYSYSNGTETNTTGSFMQPAGTTTYTVTDAAGCTYSFDNSLIQPSAIVANAAVTSNYNGAQVSCFGRADGQITLTASGGTGTLSYSLDGVSTNNTGVFSNLAAAVYTYRVTDANGCVKSAPIELTQPAKLEVTETHTDIGCLIGGISNVTIKATGGTQPYSFTQQGQGGSTNSTGLFTQLPITQYSYQVADKNGCSAALQLAIQPNDFTAPSFSRPADITIAPSQGSNCYNALPSVTGNVTNANDDKTLASSLQVSYTDVVSTCGYSTIIKRTWHVEDGCRNAAPDQVQTITVTDNKTPYIVFATKEAKFGRGNTINGSVGVTATDGKASFDKDSKLLSPEFVKAASITRDATATINTQYTMPATDGPNPVFYPFAGITKGLGNYTVSTSTTVPINANYEKLTIKKGVTVTIGGTLYGDINIEDGAQVTFAPAGGIINIEELKIKDAKEDAKMGDAGDRPNRILFSQCTSVRIKNKVEIGKNTKFNVDGPRVTIYLGDDKNDEEKFTVSGGNTEVQANVYLKNGKLKVNGNDNQFNFNTMMTGWYIVEKLESTGKNVQWNRNACNTTSTRSTEAGPGIVRQPAQNDYFAVKALPNPSTTNFRLLVQSYSSEPVTIRISDRMGRVVSVQSNVQKNSVIMVGNNLLNGTYFAEVLQGKHRQVVQLVKLK